VIVIVVLNDNVLAMPFEGNFFHARLLRTTGGHICGGERSWPMVGGHVAQG
jgi:hypothetical protein